MRVLSHSADSGLMQDIFRDSSSLQLHQPNNCGQHHTRKSTALPGLLQYEDENASGQKILSSESLRRNPRIHHLELTNGVSVERCYDIRLATDEETPSEEYKTKLQLIQKIQS
ncbi:hypothetical protein JEQ12_002384 [Ovis aries]|uniref:Uncharacterized protein n=1 Tax=Ovis aries TaxID=9940 RepID=A0A835ZY39_SHEEP|nr:hypothetical protein JEQ12_002384 [Ovis aries]